MFATIPLLVLLVFYKSLFVFFAQDDFFLLRISQAHSLLEFFHLFIPESQAVWYRPLSSQVFFFLAQLFFGLRPFLFHIVVFITHIATAYFLYKLVEKLTKSKNTALMSAIFFATHQLHTVALSWLAAYSFIAGPLFYVLCLYELLNTKYVKSFLFFSLGLLTIEVSSILVLAYVSYIKLLNKDFKKTFVTACIALILFVIWLRTIAFPTFENTDLYAFVFSFQSISTLKFYFFRLIGIPLLIETMPFYLKLSILSMVSLFAIILIFCFGILFKRHALGKPMLFFLGLGIIGLLPFIFLENHLAPHYLSFSLLGFASLAGYLVVKSTQNLNKNLSTLARISVIALYLVIQMIGSQWTYSTHWIFTRANLAKNLVLKKNLIFLPGTEEYFSLGGDNAAIFFKGKNSN